MAKKGNKKKVEGKEAGDVLKEIESYKYKPEDKVEEKKSDDKELATGNIEVTPDVAPIATAEEDRMDQKVISKKVEITRYLTKQGFGQNATKQTFVLFKELHKLKCKEHKC